MAKMIKIVLLFILIIQVYSNETPMKPEVDSDHEERLLISAIVSKQCKALISTKSPVDPTLTVTITRLANNGAYYFAPSSTEVSFDSANQFCKDHGMHLVTINSAIENALVYNEAVAQGYTGSDSSATYPGAWIGYRDTTGGGNYKWVQPKVGTTPTFFDSGYPNGRECAGYIDAVATSADASWISYTCTDVIPFICEMEPPCNMFV